MSHTFVGGNACLRGGYQKFPEKLAEGLDIRFNHVVLKIDHSGDTITVHTKDHGIFSGKHVVLTASIGVLQKGSIAINPPLPDHYQKSINSLRMALMNKVGIFWNTFSGNSKY